MEDAHIESPTMLLFAWFDIMGEPSADKFTIFTFCHLLEEK